MRTGPAAKSHRGTPLRDMLAAVARDRRHQRVCVTCRASYHASRGVHPDPRCPKCAELLAHEGDHDLELGAGD